MILFLLLVSRFQDSTLFILSLLFYYHSQAAGEKNSRSRFNVQEKEGQKKKKQPFG